MNRAICCLTLLTLASTLAAQSPRTVDWPKLRSSVEGKSATVRLRDGAVVTGRVSGASGKTLTVSARSVACSDIASVELQKKPKRVLWAVVGGAAGLAAGAALGTRFSNEGNDGAAAGLAGGLAAGGAAIGYLAGGKGKTHTLMLEPGACSP